MSIRVEESRRGQLGKGHQVAVGGVDGPLWEAYNICPSMTQTNMKIDTPEDRGGANRVSSSVIDRSDASVWLPSPAPRESGATAASRSAVLALKARRVRPVNGMMSAFHCSRSE